MKAGWGVFRKLQIKSGAQRSFDAIIILLRKIVKTSSI